MAKLVYAPADGERQEWEFAVDDLTGDQLILLEDTLDMTFSEWQELLQRGSMKAMLALCWILRRETESGLSWSDAKKIKLTALSVESEDEDAEGEVPKETSTPDTENESASSI